MKKFFFETFQKALNHFLALDPESINRLKALQGKTVTIELPFEKFALFFSESAIEVSSNISDHPDLTIKGKPFGLLHMSLSKDKRKHFFSDNVSIEGNLELGQQVTDLFDQLEIDWEEWLSKWIGDMPAHQIGRVARGFKNFTERFSQSLSRNINEYVHEEADLFPPREALQDFFEEVDILRMDVDRVEARILKIKRGVE